MAGPRADEADHWQPVGPTEDVVAEHELISPTDADAWRAYHDIRRRVLFEARGEFGIYDDKHPDERAVGNHPMLLLHRGDPVGVVRIDLAPPTAFFRRVAVRSEVQRHGHGRVLLALAQQFAQANGCQRLASYVAPDAVDFYQRCGFTVDEDVSGPSGRASVFMTKRI